MAPQPRRTAAGLAAAAALCLLLAAGPAAALTNPDQLQIITAFRDAMLARPSQVNWTKALASWTCPTPADNSVGGACDPCGQEVRQAVAGRGVHCSCLLRRVQCTAGSAVICMQCTVASTWCRHAQAIEAPAALPRPRHRLCRCGATGSTWPAAATASLRTSTG